MGLQLFEKIKEKNIRIFVIIGLAAGLLLIALSFLTDRSARDPSEQPAAIEVQPSDLNEQIAYLEHKVRGMIEKIRGVDSASVMITLESSAESIYASRVSSREGANQTDWQQELAVVRNRDGSEVPVTIKEISPRINGVAVVTNGSDVSAQLQLDITNLIAALFNIPRNRIFVINS